MSGARDFITSHYARVPRFDPRNTLLRWAHTRMAAGSVPLRRIRAAGNAGPWGGGSGREFVENLTSTGTEPWNKWYHWTSGSSTWVEADLDGPTQLASYSVQSANDCPHRDPAAWTLLGKRASDGEWETLHSVDDFAFTARFQAHSFPIDAACQKPVSVSTRLLRN